jgi:hypothetical protein
VVRAVGNGSPTNGDRCENSARLVLLPNHLLALVRCDAAAAQFCCYLLLEQRIVGLQIGPAKADLWHPFRVLLKCSRRCGRAACQRKRNHYGGS